MKTSVAPDAHIITISTVTHLIFPESSFLWSPTLTLLLPLFVRHCIDFRDVFNVPIRNNIIKFIMIGIS